MHGVIRAGGALLLLGACAHIAQPPGGPSDAVPPRLISVYPESVMVIDGFKGHAEFRFNEVVSEGGTPNFGLGTGELERLILLSPDTLIPKVEWHRDKITVEPRNGWRPNTVYRIELMPGVRDLSNNATKGPAMITFATGGPRPARILLGRIIDWTTNRAVSSAFVEAMHLPDRLVYRTFTDSTGRFHLEALPDGDYLVSGTIDRNRNMRRDRDEPWDTLRVTGGTVTLPELWAFPRDSAPPRAKEGSRADSNWVSLTLTQPLTPGFRAAADSIRVVHLPDSTNIGPVLAVSQTGYDSLRPKAAPAPKPAAAGDSSAPQRPPPIVAPPRDTSSRDAPIEKRPVLNDKLFVRTTGRFLAGQKYWVEVHGVRAQGGAVGTVGWVVSVPEDKPAAKPDSTGAKPPVAKPDSSGRGGRGGGGGGSR